ncbi:MAG: DUF885 domain-containing protein [Gammaproteobacteria bacterium]|nr:DUF885 domain-containing protein [Gammaproteobacteria bacterium]
MEQQFKKYKISFCALLALPTCALTAGYEAERGAILAREAAVAANEDNLTENERFQTLSDLYHDHFMLEFPEYYNELRRKHRWTDHSLEAIRRREQDSLRALEIICSLKRNNLRVAERLNYDLLLRYFEDITAEQQFKDEYLVVDHLGSAPETALQMVASMPAETVAEYERILAALRGLPTLVDQTLVLLQEGLKLGVTPPPTALRNVPRRIGLYLHDDSEASSLLSAFEQIPKKVPESERERLRDTAREEFEATVRPALQELYAYLQEIYLPQARRSIAMKGLPDGRAWYATRVRQQTTTDLTPLQIHELGQSEVRRIRMEMDRVIVQSGFKGSFPEFIDFVQTDPRFFYDTPEALMRGYRDIAKRADPKLVKLFGRLPRLPYGVIPMPANRSESPVTILPAYYIGGSMAAALPGQFMVNTSAVDRSPKWEMEALTLHEAVPGHHLQQSVAQEIGELPWFRNFDGMRIAFVEGWALYAESLGAEMAFMTIRTPGLVN